MQKIFALALSVACLISSQASLAQSSHDKVSGRDTDFMDNTSKFAISSPDKNFKLGFRGHLQHDNEYMRFMQVADNKNRFGSILRRARIKMYGNAFDPSITYFFQMALDQNGGTFSEHALLRDYYVNLGINDHVQVRFGKFRSPFARQQMISTSQMQFKDQDAATNKFQVGETGRATGLMFHNGFDNEMEYALALTMDGVVLRLGYNYGGIDPYEMADFAGGPLRFAIAGNAYWKTDWNNFDNVQEDIRAGADFLLKVEGFSTNGAFYFQREKATKEADAESKIGGMLDLGYMATPEIEPVLRASLIMPLADNSTKDLEVTGGLNYYVYGHHLKAQLYGGANIKMATETKVQNILAGLNLQFAL